MTKTTTEFRAGDVVDAVRGTTMMRGTLVEEPFYDDLRIDGTGWGIDTLAAAGWTVTKAPVAPVPPLDSLPPFAPPTAVMADTLATIADAVRTANLIAYIAGVPGSVERDAIEARIRQEVGL